jgi:hypothetical protein
MVETLVKSDPSGELHVTLCDEDYGLARTMGAARCAEAQQANRLGRAGCPPNNLEQDIDGAAAEIAFARAIRVSLPAMNGPSTGPDVAHFHVRSTTRANGQLIVRPGDADENVYVLVIGKGKAWRIIGTATGKEANRREYWFDRNGRQGCYMVPQSKLRRLGITPL